MIFPRIIAKTSIQQYLGTQNEAETLIEIKYLVLLTLCIVAVIGLHIKGGIMGNDGEIEGDTAPCFGIAKSKTGVPEESNIVSLGSPKRCAAICCLLRVEFLGPLSCCTAVTNEK